MLRLVSGLLLATILWAAPTMAREPVPEGLKSIASEFTLLEEAFREGEWAEANEEAERLKDRFGRLEPTLMKSAGSAEERGSIRAFREVHGKLAAAIAAKDAEKSEAAFHDVQELTINYVEFFDYDRHPLVEFFDEEIEEMTEELDYATIKLEVEEMEEVYEALAPALLNRGASKETFEGIERALEALEAAAEAEDEAKTLEQLEALAELNKKLTSSK